MELTKTLLGREMWLVSDKISAPWSQVVCVVRHSNDKWTMIYLSGYRIDVLESVKDVLELKFGEALTVTNV